MRFLSQIQLDSIPIILGLGALHTVRSLVLSPMGQPVVIVWEPLLEVFDLPAFQSEMFELSETAKEKGFTLVLVTGLTPKWNEIKENLPQFTHSKEPINRKWALYVTPSYERYFPKLIEECRENFLSQFQSQNTNQNTIQHFRKVWTHNYLKNKSTIEETKTSIQWFQSYRGTNSNVLFLGASPGLERDIESIKKHRNTFTLFASDTSIGFLLKHSILPDYILSFDSGRGTLFHFLVELPTSIPIITWLGGSSCLFELPNPKILVNTGHPLDQIVSFYFQNEKGLDWPHIQNPSLNLLGMAMSITKEIFNRNLVLSGVSFVSEFGKSHCNGTGYERYYLPQLHRKQSMECFTKRLYSGVRKGKNQLVWDELLSAKTKEKIQIYSELTAFNTNSSSEQQIELNSFQGFPPRISDLAKWANQDQSGIIHSETLNVWLRFSLG
ncbi:DUF115 domain-containing protein [Leptospira levettii]|uniref:6-hydroxymethylpterin diphosphokinase MptE-like protein n=1 Tax=Leptospira levettii TaxID=2023178 RepID=UPI001FED3832|nr:6-hydroxymethylpterin diphosphokinase MptE-like protein [Leptospira levettii]MCW7496862.1 DUF115 domain-containing protein [Leptospira levettii]